MLLLIEPRAFFTLCCIISLLNFFFIFEAGFKLSRGAWTCDPPVSVSQGAGITVETVLKVSPIRNMAVAYKLEMEMSGVGINIACSFCCHFCISL